MKDRTAKEELGDTSKVKSSKASPTRQPRAKSKNTLVRLLSYLKPHWPYVVAISVTLVGTAALDLAQPWIMGFLLFGDVITNKNIGFLPWVIVLLALTFGAKRATSFVKDYLTETLSQKTVHRLRFDVFQHVERLPMKFLDNSQTGDVVSRVMSDTEEVQGILTTDVANIAADLITVVGAFALLLFVDSRLALLVVPVMVTLVVVVVGFKRTLKRASKKIREAVGALSARTYEVISGIRIVKSFSSERYEAQKFHDRSMAIMKAKVKVARLSSIYASAVDLMTTLAVILLLAFAVPSVVSGTLALGALVAFLGYLEKLFKPLVNLSKANLTIQKAVASGERIFEIADAGLESVESRDPIKPQLIRGRIVFDKVSFSYEPDRHVLDDFSLEIEPGRTVALVGRSGAGKSTIVNLLLRFYEPDSGQILVDAYPIKSLELSYLRNSFGLVLQDPVLFSDSVRDNIAYGNIHATDRDVIRAAKAANADEFIRGLPQGYSTQIGERGVKLSVGQRQRIAIARALLKDPRVLILDEATSNMDSESEMLIQDALTRLIRGRTTIVIAHRLSTIIAADRIVVIEDGGIVESGTHATLMEKDGAYARLYEAQLSPQMGRNQAEQPGDQEEQGSTEVEDL